MEDNTQSLAVKVVISGVPTSLTYLSNPEVGIGYQVTVPLGKRRVKGWIIDNTSTAQALKEIYSEKNSTKSEALRSSQTSFLGDKYRCNSAPSVKLKGLKQIIEFHPCFNGEQLDLFRWMTAYYGHPLADVIDNAVPRKSIGRLEQQVVVRDCVKLDLLSHSSDEWLKNNLPRAKLQTKLLKYLANHPGPQPISNLEFMGISVRQALKALEAKNFVDITSTPKEAKIFHQKAQSFDPEKPEKIVTLNQEQQYAVEQISKTLKHHVFDPHLLYGVTGSGKTEVYIRCIEEVLKAGGGALIIVPEISLTPQLFDRFHSRLQCPIALLHSQIGDSSRWTAWQSLLNQETRVVIGARSAVFAPVPNLALIIVDEEHESSYKQSDGLRYHGRDIAVMRAKFANCPIILGSATPSFETLLNVKKGAYKLLKLPNRATPRPLPTIEVVDLSKIRRKNMPSESISPRLFQAIEETLSNNEQIVILYNRRGFASYLQCSQCQEAVTCPDCSLTLTYHKNRNLLVCHYCNSSIPPPRYCRFCRNPDTTRKAVDDMGKQLETDTKLEKLGVLIHRGSGTEKIQEELELLFPQAKIVRMDRDTTIRKNAYRDILNQMKTGEADILLGTQMIAKGHDLPGVTLVGVLDADIGLHIPDFRSSEKVFQLLTQAAGRAGRGDNAGLVIIQTREPDHAAILASTQGRFKEFANYELQQRKKLSYPPWGRLMRVIISHPDMHEVTQGVTTLKNFLEHALKAMTKPTPDRQQPVTASLLGPSPCPYEKLRGRYRWHFLIKSNSPKLLSQLAHKVQNWKRHAPELKNFRVTADIDPIDML